jgi:hypothetical protein
MLPRMQAEEQLRALSVETFVHLSGDSSDPKQAARQGTRKRRKIVQDLHRQALGVAWDEIIPGVDALQPSDLRGWFSAHGLGAVVQ